MINIKILFIFLFIILLILIFTRFEKEITVKSKYTIHSSFGKSKYYIVDTNNNVYQITDNLLLFQFNKKNNYDLININQKYKIIGYSFRINSLKIYPKIYDLKKYKS